MKLKYFYFMITALTVASMLFIFSAYKIGFQDGRKSEDILARNLKLYGKNCERLSFTMSFKPEKYFSDPRVIELCCALGDRNLRMIDLLVAEGVDVNARGKGNMTPLLYAFLLIAPGYTQEAHFSENSPYEKYSKPRVTTDTHKLLIKEHVQCLEHLLVYGADPNIKTDAPTGNAYTDWLEPGTSVTFLAATQTLLYDNTPGIDIFPLLMQFNADPNVVCTGFQATPLHAAVNPCPPLFSNAKPCDEPFFKRPFFYDYILPIPICASPRNVGLLIESGAEIEHRDKWQNTPLIAAAGGENFDIVLMLLEAGADYTAMNDDSQNLTYFLYVAKHMNPKIDTDESIDPYYNKVIAFLKSKDYSLENAYEELGDKLKNLPQPTENPNTRSSYQRPYDPYAGEWIEKRKEKQE